MSRTERKQPHWREKSPEEHDAVFVRWANRFPKITRESYERMHPYKPWQEWNKRGKRAKRAGLTASENRSDRRAAKFEARVNHRERVFQPRHSADWLAE